MTFLVSAELADGARLLSIEPWLEQKDPVWQGAAPLGIFLSGQDVKRFAGSDFAAVMDVMSVPVAEKQALQDFCAAAMAARIDLLMGEAAGERAAAAALRQDFMQLQENFLAVEGFLSAALTPKFTLAREWVFGGTTHVLKAGETLQQHLPASSASLVAVDLWMVSGRLKVSILRADGSKFVEAGELAGHGWQRLQFPAIAGAADEAILRIDALEACEVGLSHPSPLPEFGSQPMALRLWKGLTGVRLPTLATDVSGAQLGEYIMPDQLPAAESLGQGNANYLENSNTIMIHTDYYGAANLAFRDLGFKPPVRAHIQNCGPETLEVQISQVGAGQNEPAKHCLSVFLAPEAYMQCDVVQDQPDASDLIIKVKGQTSLDCLSLRGFEIG